ncbi:MAG: helix-turn-helix transcriptional regulator [Cyanobacteria bacterium]|nr:helix-turn-helix transcriptional regulator [Cyanobacteriota bacterium]MDA1246647.1 helix-turn-helix transcriptional regulator [Cyanobacteriota bacterium]
MTCSRAFEHPELSAAERRVLQQLERGYSNKAIASVLILSRRTVESHMSSLLAKTGCQSRTQLLLWALAER